MPAKAPSRQIAVLWVPWKSPSENQIRGKHWTVALRFKKHARQEWLSASHGFRLSLSAAALMNYCACLAAGDWQGYPCLEMHGAKFIEPAPWMLTSGMEAMPEIQEPVKPQRESEMPS